MLHQFHKRWIRNQSAFILVMGSVAAFHLQTASVAADPLVYQHSNKCMATTSDAAGAAFLQATCDGSDGQAFGADPVQGGIRYVNKQTGMCLTVQGASTTRDIPIVQEPCGAGEHQVFSPIYSGPGTATLRANHSDLCFGVTGSQQQDGATIVTWTCGTAANYANQIFNALPGALPKPEASGDPLPLVFSHSNRCMAPTSGTSGAALRQAACDGSAVQSYVAEAVNGGVRYVDNQTNLCLTVENASSALDTPMVLATCGAGNHQVFNTVVSESGNFLLRAAHSNLCFGVIGPRRDVGAPIGAWHCWITDGHRNLMFNDLPEPGTQPEPTVPAIPLVYSHSNKCMQATGAGSGSALVQATCNGSDAQAYSVEAANGGGRYINAASGLCLAVQNASTERDIDMIHETCGNGDHQIFTAVDAGNGAATLRASHSGLCFGVRGKSGADGAAVVTWICGVTDNFANQIFNDLPNATGADGGTPAGLIPPAISGPTPVSQGPGVWDGPFETPLVAVAAAALPDGNVLTWSAYDRFEYRNGSGNVTLTSIFDTANYTASEMAVRNTGHDMFCPGISMLASGDILITGGNAAAQSTIYSPLTDTWSATGDMNIPRGYQASTTMPNGDVFTVGGSWSGGRGGKIGERYSPASQAWTRLNNVPVQPLITEDDRGIFAADNHMWLFAAPNGLIFQAGPSDSMHWIDPDAVNGVQFEGQRGTVDMMNAKAVMYDVGKILAVGGAENYGEQSPSFASAWAIDINGGIGNVEARQLQDMSYARAFSNAAVLPSGEVVIVGGTAQAEPFSDANSVFVTEIWNPTTEQFTMHGMHQTPRNYHSTALLLKDGRVWMGGGGLCGGCATNHPNAEIFTPPYLVTPDGTPRPRPRVLAAPAAATHGETIQVQADQGAANFVLMRLGTATHSVNTDQRRVPVIAVATGGNTFDISIPSNPGIVTPGNYYLFAMSADGVPSVAETINIQ